MNEIKINKPKISVTLSDEAQNIIKDRVIFFIKKLIQEDNYSFLDYLLDEVYIPGGDSNYNIVASFVIEQMIVNNYELYKNGEEILLTPSNSNLITKEDIENYIQENQGLKKYLEKLTWEYYFDQIDINDLYKESIKAVKNDMKRGNWGEGEYDKDDFESIVDKTLDQHDLWPDIFLTYNPEFQDYLQTQFLRADKLNEMRNIQLLREYPESTISKILTKWGLDPDPKSQDSKAKAARALINRFEQIKASIPQKLNILVIPDDIKNKDPRNIEFYSLEDMIKLIKSYPENPDKIKKDAIENFVTKYQIDKPTAQSYVARFMAKKDNLKYAIGNGTEDGNFTKEEVLELIPKRLLQNDLYLDPRNWQWQSFEQMLDALFPSQKQATGEENNTATTDADKIYDKDGIEIYQGDDVHKCISYNPVSPETKRKKYGWCVTQIGNTNYDYYRFGDKSPTFYFVFDRSKDSSPEHAPFKDQWHALVIQVNSDGESYVVTGADNRGDIRADSWERISQIVPADTWAKIKDLKPYFKPIPLSAVERGRKFASGRNLSLDEFKELSQDEKILYIQGKASKNALPNDILDILSQYKINYEGRSTTLANVAIDSGQIFPYSILKDNEALAKRYAIFRFRHTNYGSIPIPLPYIKYLDEEGQKKYYKEFDKGGNEDSFLTFELIERYFGEEITKQYVNSQLKHLGFLPPEAIKYIDNPKLKTLFKTVSKLYKPWQYGRYTNISDEELANAKSQPPQDVTPMPIDVKQWGNLSSEERKIIIELTEKYNQNPQYTELMYASPFIIKDKGQTLVLLPEPSSTGNYEKWVLVNDQDKVVKRNISGNSTLDGDEIESGYNNAARDDLKRVYNIDELNIIESNSKSLNEIKVNKPNILKIIKWNNDWGLLANNKYLFADTYHSPNRPELDNYNIIYAQVDVEGDMDDPNEYLEVHIPEPSFGGGGDPEEIDEAYDEWENNLDIAEQVLLPYSFYSIKYEGTYKIKLNKIGNRNLIPALNEIKVNKPGKSISLKLPKNIKTVDMDNDDEVEEIIKIIIKLNPDIPKDIFEAGSVFDDVTDWIGNGINEPVVPFKVFLESYFYWLSRNLIYDLDPENENLDNNDYDSNEFKRFANAAANGKWLLIPGISDFRNPISEIKINKPNDLSNPNNLKRLLDKIPNEKYFQVLKDEEEENLKYGISDVDPSDYWDYLYEPLFNNELKGKPGVEYNDFYELQEKEREKNNDEVGPLERLIINKIWSILNDYRNQQGKLREIQIKDGNDLWELMKPEFEKFILEDLDEIKVNTPGFKTWDFTKYIPNFNPNKIKEGDIFILPNNNDTTPYRLKIEKIINKIYWFVDGEFVVKLSNLINLNKENKKSLDEIKVNKPFKNWKERDKYYHDKIRKEFGYPVETEVGDYPFYGIHLQWDDDALKYDSEKGWLTPEEAYNHLLKKSFMDNNLDEIKINKPGGGDYMKIWPIGELINFFKNDQYVFKRSNIDKIITQNIKELKKRIWESYKDFYMEYDEDNEYVKDYPKNPHEIFNLEKQTGNLDDAKFIESGNFILPYISKFLNDNEWEYMGDDVFKKDDTEIEIVDYIYNCENELCYDTDPVEAVYENFERYFKENNPSKIDEIQINKPGKEKLKIIIEEHYGNILYGFEMDGWKIHLIGTDVLEDYNNLFVQIHNDLYDLETFEHAIRYLNENKIPFVIYDKINNTIIRDNKFKIPEYHEDINYYHILINKKDCEVPKEYQENFNNL